MVLHGTHGTLDKMNIHHNIRENENIRRIIFLQEPLIALPYPDIIGRMYVADFRVFLPDDIGCLVC